MTLDPRNSVRPGQRLSIAADQINYLNRLMRGSSGLSGDPLGQGFSAPYTWIYCKNNTGSTVARWGVMKIAGIEVTPTASDSDRATSQFCEMPVVAGHAITGSESKWCIAIEPIKAGEIGRVAVDGVVQVKKADLPKLACVTVIWDDDNWALIKSGDTVRLGKTTAAWDKGTLADIELYEEGIPPDETRNATDYTLGNCVNKFSDVASGKWVMVAKAKNGSWYLIAAECDTPGGSGGS